MILRVPVTIAAVLLTLVVISVNAISSPLLENHLSSNYVERERYKTRDEFHDSVIDAKAAYENGGKKTYHHLEDYDFSDLADDVELDEIVVTYNSIALYYNNGSAPDFLIVRYIDENVDEELYLKSRRKSGSIDITINGKAVVKQEVYYDNEHVVNQYFWVENGNAIQVNVPEWLLEQYPEETFFDIQVVKILPLKSDAMLLSVTSGGETIFPMRKWHSDRTWHNGWISGDSFYWQITPFEEYCDSIPSVILSSDFSISENPGFLFAISKGEPGQKSVNNEHFSFEMLKALESGTYYVRLRISFQLEYVPDGNGYNTSTYDYFFRLVVPAKQNVITVTLNNKPLNFDQPPVMENDRVLVPFRAIFEALGAEVAWDERTQIVTAKKDGIDLSLRIGDEKITINSQTITLDVAPRILNGRTLVPVRAVSEGLGAKVDWDGANKQVFITC